MSDKLLFAISVLTFAIGIGSVGFEYGAYSVERQAFERGYMVQCPGKAGYYWECEE